MLAETSSMLHRPQPYFTTAEVASICDVSIVCVGDWIRDGKLRAYRPPRGHYRVARPDLRQFLQQNGMPVPAPLLDGRRMKVLVVDDEPMVRAVVANILESVGDMDVATAADGFEAGKLVAELHPNVVVLDLRMPGLDGPTVCQRIKNDPKTAGTRILFLTGYNDPDSLQVIRRCGGDGYIPKPFVAKDLIEAVHDLGRPNSPRPVTTAV